MMHLPRTTLEGHDPRWRGIEAAGGLFVASAGADPVRVRDAVLAQSIRALEIHGAGLEGLEGLPLEYLIAAGTNVDAAPIATMPLLRGLGLDSWTGRLAFDRLPALQWFGVTETEPSQLDELFTHGHPSLEWLSVGRYRESDLTALSQLARLRTLSIVDSRSLASLAGIGGVPNLTAVDVAICPKLQRLDGIDQAAALRAVTLESCNRIDDLAPVAGLPRLKVLQVEMRRPPPLGSLVGHSSLEFLWLIGGTRPPEEVDALLTNAALRMVTMRRTTWMRNGEEWHHCPNIYDMGAREAQQYETLLEHLNRRKYGDDIR